MHQSSSAAPVESWDIRITRATAATGAAAILGTGLWAFVSSPWLEKPARESQIVDLQRSVSELKTRADQADDRSKKIEDALHALVQNMAAMSEAQRHTTEQVSVVGRQISELSLVLIKAHSDEQKREARRR